MPGNIKSSPTTQESQKENIKGQRTPANLKGKSDEIFDNIEGEKLIKLAKELEQNYKIENINFNDLSKLTWTEDLENKMNLLKGKPYAPIFLSQVLSLDKIDKKDVNRKVYLATRLKEEYDIDTDTFHGFEKIDNLDLTDENFKKKLNLLKGKPYAPINSLELLSLYEMDFSDIEKNIILAEESIKNLNQYGINKFHFYRFQNNLPFTITNELRNKLNLLKGKSYAPNGMYDIYSLMTTNESIIENNIKLAEELQQKYKIVVSFFDLIYILPKIDLKENLKEEYISVKRRILKNGP